MTLLITGLVLFVALHLIPSSPSLRESLVDKFKLTGYKTLFSLLSIISIVFIVYGLKGATYQALYEPPGWGRHLAMFLMLPALYLFFSNSVGSTPSSAKVITAHPLNWAVILWASAHLLANGDLAHVLLFSTFLIFSVISIVTGNSRGLKSKLKQRPPIAMETIFVVIVVLVYCALVWGHKYFTGVPILAI